jgi:H/ACA ribonucleoprotein complex subunit 4
MIVLRKEKPLKTPAQPIASGAAIIIDKPSGPSSHEVTAWVSKAVNSRAGHSGTLDPKVTGVLVIAYGKARKLLRVFSKNNKEYVCLARFEPEPDQKKLEQAFQKFTGTVKQTPPAQAAVKKIPRKRKIHELELLEKNGKQVLFKVKCQHGTYIRVLVRDLARAMSVKGEMLELRRTAAGPFTEDQCVTMQQVVDATKASRLAGIVLPMNQMTSHLPSITVGNNAVAAVAHGANLAKPGVAALDENIEKDQAVALNTVDGQLLGIAKSLHSSKQILEMDKGVVTDTLAIVLDAKAYPKKWKKP